jgi:hypothetical protein
MLKLQTIVQSSLPHPFALLRARRERPRRRAADEQYELAPPDHSITSSARASSLSGIWRPSALAVLRLMASSNAVGRCTGRSVGFSASPAAVRAPLTATPPLRRR